MKKKKATLAVMADVASSFVSPSEEAVAKASKATSSTQWIVAAFRIEEGKLVLDRTAVNFPKEDIPLACRLFVEDMEKLKGQ